MSQGLNVVSLILEQGNTEQWRRLNPEWLTPGEVEVHGWIDNYLSQFGRLPTVEATEEATSTVFVELTDNNLDYHLDQLRDRNLFYSIRDPYNRLQSALSSQDLDGARSAVEALSALQSSGVLSRQHVRFKTLRDAYGEVIEHYDRNHGHGGVTGVTTGWSYLDDLTGGFQPGDLITLVARMGVGKTMLLLHLARHAWLNGHKILFVSMEMLSRQLCRRHVAMMTGVDPTLLRKSMLSTAAWQRVQQQMYEDSVHPLENYVYLEGELGRSVDAVRSAIDEVRPDIVFIDGAYFLQPRGYYRSSVERIEAMVNQLKSITIDTDLPIAITTQFNRDSGSRGRGGSLETIRNSDAYGTDSSLVMSIMDGLPPDEKTRRILRILKGREGEAGAFEIRYQFRPTDFSQIGEVRFDEQGRVLNPDGTPRVTGTAQGQATNLDWMRGR